MSIIQSKVSLVGQEANHSKRHKSHLFFASFMAFAFIFLCTAQNFAIASSYTSDSFLLAENKEHNQDVQKLQSAADSGDVEAQAKLGGIHYYARGVKQDFEKAGHYFKSAAERGHARSENHLGRMYERGEGFKQDNVKAVAHYEKAANQGLAEAQYNLGRMYEDGKGVKQDNAKAKYYFELAAKQGYAEAETSLKDM